MSASWEVASVTQISRSGAAETGTLATQVAEQIGGTARSVAGGIATLGDQLPHGLRRG